MGRRVGSCFSKALPENAYSFTFIAAGLLDRGAAKIFQRRRAQRHCACAHQDYPLVGALGIERYGLVLLALEIRRIHAALELPQKIAVQLLWQLTVFGDRHHQGSRIGHCVDFGELGPNGRRQHSR